MRALLQRVTQADVIIDGKLFSAIGRGVLVFLGIHRSDTEKQIAWMADKILSARIFDDKSGKIGKSVDDTGGEILVVSQITLYGKMRNGNRPDFGDSMRPAQAKIVFEQFVATLRHRSSLNVASGKFGASMNIRLTNEGPVTVMLDSDA